MPRYLVFQLYGAMASWGEPAVGEVRHTSAVPTRSALLGLLAAALGIRRDASQRLNQLNSHYQIAVRVLKEGNWMRDYHSIQTPRESRKLHFATRKDELRLAPQDLETMLSSREYRCDAYYHVAIAETAGAPHTLDELQAALSRPTFPLYLGRKSCPLALPLTAHCVEGELAQVFHQAEATFTEKLAQISAIKPGSGWGKRCYWEGEHNSAGITLLQTTERRDQPLNRKQWQFGLRLQHHGELLQQQKEEQ